MSSMNEEPSYKMPSSQSIIEQNINVCINSILNARKNNSITTDFLTQYREILTLLTPRERINEQNVTLNTVERYLAKKRKWITHGSIRSMVGYHLYRNYMKALIRKIAGNYGIAGPHVLTYHVFSSQLHKTFKTKSPSSWLDEIEREKKRLMIKWTAEDEKMAKTDDEILFIVGIVSARVFFYIDYSNEGRDEVENIVERILKDIEWREGDKGEEGDEEQI